MINRSFSLLGMFSFRFASYVLSTYFLLHCIFADYGILYSAKLINQLLKNKATIEKLSKTKLLLEEKIKNLDFDTSDSMDWADEEMHRLGFMKKKETFVILR